ncbi:hypothetical protein CWI42_121730 [Ordospora colligata]|uniref:Uncharacterized protein n=1 Tax=Ordospora colligata OC4 TaxID=1354746 RepID=A0A0B2UIZ0_9MICR|nr:uncharacterized protein M896_121730 [Ordospora colligata OC4]KHN68950.1 hypothetical protein M896_121730 [Ordospora colligata OC4]TBU13984.1 hypothetical protein CWI40_121730 [Ordospora colligata]TBU14173.1 hypothetical protein CWI41_121730 [Ordospora colligata]TBU17842.1 hypothetical protein CWI42_121730 [Ordospora colligata]
MGLINLILHISNLSVSLAILYISLKNQSNSAELINSKAGVYTTGTAYSAHMPVQSMNAKEEISVAADIKEDAATTSIIDSKKEGEIDALSDSPQTADSAISTNSEIVSSGMMSKSRLMANPSAFLMSMKHGIN